MEHSNKEGDTSHLDIHGSPTNDACAAGQDFISKDNVRKSFFCESIKGVTWKKEITISFVVVCDKVIAFQ